MGCVILSGEMEMEMEMEIDDDVCVMWDVNSDGGYGGGEYCEDVVWVGGIG